jgi:N-acetylneuraminic acid mutarotase
MKYRLLLPGALILNALGLAACGDEITTQPDLPGQPPAALSELAITRNSWITRANMPGDRSDLATATVTNAAGQSVLYAIGGVKWSRPLPGTPVAKVTAYNVATNTWTDRRSLPKPLAGTNGAGVLNGKIYVTGGYPDGGSNWPWPTVYMYDPATNSWMRKRDMPTVNGESGREYPAGGGVTGVIGGKLYVVSGCYLKDLTYGSLSEYCSPLFLRYNATTDRWVVLPPPFPESTPGLITEPSIGGVIDGKFYVMASAGPASSGNEAYFAAYDPATNKWTRRTPLGLERPGAASAVLGGKLYVMGGLRFNGVGLDILDITVVYDPVTDTWTRRASLPSPRYDISASKVLLDGKPRIELVGGIDPENNNLQYIP